MTARSAQNRVVELDLLKSMKHMRKENFAAKKDLQALYSHKLDKLKDCMLEEKRNSEIAIKEKLKFAQHSTNLQRQRADNFRVVADEFAGIAHT